MAWFESKQLELSHAPTTKALEARANYTLLVPLILFAQSTDLFFSCVVKRKRGVATDTPRVPKQQHSGLCAHNCHEQYGCSATSATVSVTTLSPRHRSVLTAFLQLRYRKLKQSERSHSHFQLLLMKTRRSHDADARC